MSNLWSVNSEGKTFLLSTSGQQWDELQYHGVDIKRISANEFFTWAISGDHQIYIFVHARDVPIRCRVVSYQNERWNPVHGFSNKLLPTDRPQWSSSDGLVALPLNSFHLPSSNWQWEAEWHVEDNLNGQPLEPDGWTYAIDFPAKYGPNKTWNSLVRRRKWVRYRRYSMMNCWALVPSIHEDPVKEPFIDVSVGGMDVPGGDTDKFSVWAVTILGRVVFRYGVTTSAPEGTGWVPVDTPEKCEVSQIATGPTGMVWALTWEGHALVRTGVTRENAMGISWATVNAPTEEDKLMQISVGTNTVWAVSRNRTVWFRKGVKGFDAVTNDSSALGNSWIKMVGQMLMTSVGLYDQVCAISPDGSTIYLRTGVCPNELSGRTWKSINVPIKTLLRLPSLSSLESYSSSSTHRDSIHGTPRRSGRISSNSTKNLSQESDHLSPNLNDPSAVDQSDASSTASGSSGSRNLVKGSICGIEGGSYNPSGSDWDCSHAGIGEVFDDLHSDFCWTWISSGGCHIEDGMSLWFTQNKLLESSGQGEEWYDDILSKFRDRGAKEVRQFSSVPRAVEKTAWIKTGSCEWYKDCQWAKCVLELKQQGSEYCGENAVLTCHHKNEQHSINLKDITCILRILDRTRSILAIYTGKYTARGMPHKLSFSSEELLEDWWAALNNSCCSIHSLCLKPEKNSFWATTNSGDVYVHNTMPNEETHDPSKYLWLLLGGGHLRAVETCPIGITWGVGYDGTAWVYSNGFGGGPFRGISGCNVSLSSMSDTRCFYIYENQRWNPVTGFTAKGLPTDRYMWSDQTGRHECTKENTHLPSSHWQWISDWCIDYKTPSGVDNQGWQYATDFPRSYHAYKSFTDYVRRRRWIRKCRLLTNGPWKQLGTTRLLDVALQIDPYSRNEQTISVWAVATNGDVLRRIGVTPSNPTGESWIHIPTDKPFRSITIGADNAVWGIASDGSAHLRHAVSPEVPNGLLWCYIDPPEVGCHLRQISAGRLTVLAVDDANRMWCRQEIVEIFKEGTHWKHVCDNVKQVSVGPMDQIWALVDNFETQAGNLSGVICQRIGVNCDNIAGTEWRQCISGNWSHLCIRAGWTTSSC